MRVHARPVLIYALLMCGINIEMQVLFQSIQLDPELQITRAQFDRDELIIIGKLLINMQCKCISNLK